MPPPPRPRRQPPKRARSGWTYEPTPDGEVDAESEAEVEAEVEGSRRTRRRVESQVECEFIDLTAELPKGLDAGNIILVDGVAPRRPLRRRTMAMLNPHTVDRNNYYGLPIADEARWFTPRPTSTPSTPVSDHP